MRPLFSLIVLTNRHELHTLQLQKEAPCADQLSLKEAAAQQATCKHMSLIRQPLATGSNQQHNQQHAHVPVQACTVHQLEVAT
jgi:hypothetical protein